MDAVVTPDPAVPAAPVVTAATPADWRAWLAAHHDSATEVWLVLFHRDSGTPSVRYAEAVEEALCVGWVDGHHRPRDEHSSQLRFTPRRAGSRWSRVNRDRAARLIDEGRMTEAGGAAIERARAAGTWQVLSDEEADTVPADLQEGLDGNPDAARHFAGFPPSTRRLILEWIATAKRPETRQRRIDRTVELAADDVRAR